ncbi:50S ribosomal protein L11 methyltransferase [Hyphomicrobium sulfonivorans]|uniref:50S ribosomal protein L11 methyltransferase n=1 Tax=Hyphomicrobium sulfonivorans TaxID=121290 RepID=UPI00156ED279|nr:50S ribosomal protein L11 methyltransferase [Hyphomicrobium sulfonivorans]MBI1649014.1 50S ribosomal protein L11 methyltransferase [Hyphomicrobium sulfonivorans]NSL70451.1 ribonucleotide-diphosphate reductase subunit beta [Hyphomicrobium sulfonivorans]
MRIEYHRTLIADRPRNEAFQKALASVIRKGETTVADIGTGTGLLALMAAKLGARDVYLYEVAEVGAVAEALIEANGAQNCHLIPCHSTEMVDPPQVDVIVSETLGNYALEEHIIETLADAKARFLKPGGVMIPQRIVQYVAPVIAPRIQNEFAVWDETGFDMSIARTMSLNNIYVRTLKPDELLAAQVWDTVELGSDADGARAGEVSWQLADDATVYGFVVWWDVELVPGITLSTAPDAPPTHWEQLYFPLLSPIAAKSGDTIHAVLQSHTSHEEGTHVAWAAMHVDANGKEVAQQSLNLDNGYLP